MAAPRKDYEKAIKWYFEGHSVALIAEEFGVSPGAIRSALTVRSVPVRSDRGKGLENSSRSNGLLICNARKRLRRAVKNGRLSRPDTCERCGDKGRLGNKWPFIIAHHQDYSDALNVAWLCRSCHSLVHLDPENNIEITS